MAAPAPCWRVPTRRSFWWPRHLVLGVVAEAAADPAPLRVTAEPFVRDFVHDVREVKFTLMP